MDGSENQHRNPNAPLRILSLDGGGVRGLSSLMVLDHLMKNIAMEEQRLGCAVSAELKPCDYFDLIGGTSTGGIIAILLGRLRLTTGQCIKVYQELAKEIFRKDRVIKVGSIKVPLSSYRFSGKVLERKIKDQLRQMNLDPELRMWDGSLFYEDQDVPSAANSEGQQSQQCSMECLDETTSVRNVRDGNIAVSSRDDPTIRIAAEYRHIHRHSNKAGCHALVVTAMEQALGLPRILATYDPHDKTTKIWEALRATSAAPTFFEPIEFGTPAVRYLDGGMGWNNPCQEVVYQARQLWNRPIGLVVSIGTGLQELPKVRKIAPWLPFGLGTDIALASALAAMATSTARVHNEMLREYCGSETTYFRFDVEGVSGVSLEQWMREVEISSRTRAYMEAQTQHHNAIECSCLIVQLTHLPRQINIPADRFLVGIRGTGLITGSFRIEMVDFKRHTHPGPTAAPQLRHLSTRGTDDATFDSEAETVVVRSSSEYTSDSLSSIARPGLGTTQKSPLYIYPILEDLDGDGRPEEAVVLTCIHEPKLCLRLLLTSLPPGQYKLTYLIRFPGPDDGDFPARTRSYTTSRSTRTCAPTELIFSAGRPYQTGTFLSSVPDVRVTADIVPALLHPDSVRERVGRKRHARLRGRGWQELTPDTNVVIGTERCLGIVITVPFLESVAVSNWSFGGVRIEPMVQDHNQYTRRGSFQPGTVVNSDPGSSISGSTTSKTCNRPIWTEDIKLPRRQSTPQPFRSPVLSSSSQSVRAVSGPARAESSYQTSSHTVSGPSESVDEQNRNKSRVEMTNMSRFFGKSIALPKPDAQIDSPLSTASTILEGQMLPFETLGKLD